MQGGGGGGPAPSLNASQVSKDQTKGNVNAAISQSILNSTNQVTPFGSLTYNRTGGDYDFEGNFIPQWTATQTLSPEAQGLFNRGVDFSNRALNAAFPALTNVGNLAPMKDQTAYRDEAYNALMSRGGAELDRQEDAARTRLANQGVAVGSVASNRDLDTIGRARNDLTSQSLINATGLAGQNQAMDIAGRNQMFGELAQLLGLASGTPSMPQSFVNTPQTQVNATDITSPQMMAFNAANQGYQGGLARDAASSSGMTSGMMGLGGTALMAGAMFL